MECQMTKTPHLKHVAAALSPPVVPGPLEKIAIDVVGPLPLSNHGNKCLLVIIDYATKWCEAYPLRDQQATEAALCLADWVSRFGAPLAMTSDRGSAFISALVKEFCKLWDVKHAFTSAYHPQSNAQVERLNATLEGMLHTFCIQTGITWDEHIGAVLFAYRNAIHSATQVPPSILLFGQPLRAPVDAEIDLYLEHYNYNPRKYDYLFEHARALFRARDLARQSMEEQALKSAERFNANHRLVYFAVGDVVWLENKKRKYKMQPK
jgi:transposase InsO family protein